ncbi:MAG: transglycosylase SLT domain-containing protein [Candidatus Azobacteroides sp.]|nr:transglycosylase SLT domain-containing protein [Candidatus Azobacteroides sp.]
MKKLFLLLALFSWCYSYAQTTVWQEIREKMNNREEAINEDDQTDSTLESDNGLVAPEAWDTNFNNLLNSWYVTNYTSKLNQAGYQEDVPISDSVYMDRLSRLPNIIELPYNQTVRTCIEFYVERRRSLVEYMLGLEAFYFPMIEETLDKYGLPLELKYLIIVESAMNPVALSRAGASGLWQFVISTGKNYGLEINSLVDERRDPILSTDAACRHLKDLYETYDDWNLAIAAYNCGGGNVNKAIRRAGGKKDYWEIYPYLPKETRSYVPFFIAANYIMNYYAFHQLYPVQTSLPLSTDTVMVTQMIHFDQIADILQIDKDLIRALNPQYKRDIIPGNFRPQILKLPAIQAYAFVEKENEIAAYRADELLTNRTYVEGSKAVNRSERIIHKVRNGESVLTIANRYGVSAQSVRKWNNLRSNKVLVGKNLIVYIDNGGYSTSSNTSSTRSTQSYSQSALSSSAESQQENAASDRSTYSSADAVHYKVQPGDSFYTIAKKYPGYTSMDLMKLNNLTNSGLKAGQYILVPKI